MSIATEINWQQFIRENIEPKIKVEVLSSWKRSHQAKVNPYMENLIHIPKISYKKPPESKQFFNEVVDYINNCTDASIQDDSAWIFCDQEGYVLKIRPNSEDFKHELIDLGVTERISFAENSVGTNAISLCMNSQESDICIEAEHYLKVFHRFKSAASPIFNIEGTRMGYCMLIGRKNLIRTATLKYMILLLIEGVDRSFRLARSRARHDNLKGKIESAIFDNHLTPTIFLTSSGFIRQINSSAMQLLEIDNENRGETSLDQISTFTPSIKEIAHSGLQTNSIPMTIENKSGKKINVSVNRLPFYNQAGQFIGVSLQLFETALVQSKPQSNFKAKHSFTDIIGVAKGIRQAKEIAQRVAETSINVLIIGPIGTGKEMFAQSIHNASDRKNGPFVSFNSSTTPRDQAESELFGHAKTIINDNQIDLVIGKLESANGGTIFLDEIGEMPFELQAKLLMALEEKKYTSIGDNIEKNLDVRIIASTNKDLLDMIHKNEFREDLYYRLSVTSILLPSLKESRDDIPVLVQSFIEHYNEQMGKKVLGFKEEIMERLKTYGWPGNIRELRNAVEFAIMLNQGEQFIPWEHMPGHLRLPLLYQKKILENQVDDPLNTERESINRSEKALVKKAIDLSNGRMNEAAKILGISRATIYRKIKKLGIAPYN
jgi:transcriptional regulator with PAS, ATPase and Fis domain